MYTAKERRLRDAGTAPRRTSTRYDSAWKVKKEMPIGKWMFGTGSAGAATAARRRLPVETRKPAYLKKINKPRLKAIPDAKHQRENRSLTAAPAGRISSPSAQLPRMLASMTRT